MSHNLRTISYVWGLFLVAIVIAYGLQSQLFLEGDVGFLIHAAKKLAAGGSYSTQFFETNPPMILYLYMPIVWIANISQGSEYVIARVYVMILVAVSLFLSDRCATTLLEQQPLVRGGLLVMIILVLLFLPANQFAQREHMMMILTMPYWFLAAARFTSVSPIKPFYAVMIGLLAALGFALKPFFLIPLVLVECYGMLNSRRFFSWLRVENVMICMLLPIYLVSIYRFQRDYIEVILPLVSRYYFIASKETWGAMFSRPSAIYCVLSIIAASCIASSYQNTSLARVFWLSLVGFTLAFIVPRSSWYYHTLPAVGMACCLFALLLGELAQEWIGSASTFVKKVQAAGLLLLAASAVFISPLYAAYLIYAVPSRHIHNLNQTRLIQFVQFYAVHPKIYCIPSHHECTMLSEYAGAVYTSEFPSFWELKGLVAAERAGQAHPDLLRHVVSDQKDFIQRVTANMVRANPDLILIGTDTQLDGIHSSQDYIAYFSQNSLFKDHWRHYRLVKTLPNIEIYARKTD